MLTGVPTWLSPDPSESPSSFHLVIFLQHRRLWAFPVRDDRGGPGGTGSRSVGSDRGGGADRGAEGAMLRVRPLECARGGVRGEEDVQFFQRDQE